MVDIANIKYLPELPAAHVLTGADLMLINQASVDGQVTLTTLMQFFNNAAHPVGSLIEYGDKNKDPNNDFPGQTWVRLAAGNSLRVAAADDSNTGSTGGSDNVSIGEQNLPAHDHDGNGLKTSRNGKHDHVATIGNGGGHSHTAKSAEGGGHDHNATMNGAGGHWHEYAGDDQLGNGGGIFSRKSGRWYDVIYDNRKESSFYKTSSVQDHKHDFIIEAVLGHIHDITIDAVKDHYHSATIDEDGEHEHTIEGKTEKTGGGKQLNVLNKVIYVAVWKRTK